MTRDPGLTRPRPGRRVRRRALAGLIGLLGAALTASTLGPPPVFAAPPPKPPAARAVPPVKVRKAAAATAAVAHPLTASAKSPPVWPAASTVDLSVLPQPAGKAAKTAAAPSVVSVGVAESLIDRASTRTAAPATVRVDVLDRATTERADVRGLLFRVGRADGQSGTAAVNVAVDYGSFATAYGADWSARLRLVSLPECALTTPDRAECRGTALPTRNNVAAGRASADVSIGKADAGVVDESARTGFAGARLIALAAGSSSAAGSYAATSLNPSGTWSAGGSSGDFSWSYPMRTPPGLGGPAPDLSLAYSAQSVDGRMVSSNNQPSVVGEGFELSVGGYIERRYKTCSEDTGGNADNAGHKTPDQCWATDNATMSLDGHTSELLRSTDGKWHPRSDDGSRIERRTGAGNGDNDGEWWVVTSTSGTQYWFGTNKLPGAPANVTTNSTWVVPVFGNNPAQGSTPAEPCNQSTFAASSCPQAWRWNLDYVVDPHGNTMSLWYGKESDRYASGSGATQSYDRGGYLDHVYYGSRVDPDPATGTDTAFSGHPAAKVEFGYADRCLSGCATHDEVHWPDTPWDLTCPTGTCQQTGPAFWTTRRLATVKTRVFNGTSDYRDVEQWTFTHSFPDPGDHTRAGLWLDRIGHAGLNGATTTLPDVTFVGVPMNNRVDAVDESPPMNWPRLAEIDSETGARISVEYNDPECVAGSHMPAAPESNTMRCYPVRWTPPGFSEMTDYFHKYTVKNVIETNLTENNPTSGSPRILHHYDYIGAPAWHYTDDDGLISADTKTWSQWRGYSKVAITTGDPGAQTYAESVYFRGMNGDHLPNNGTRSVTVTDSQGGSVADDDAYSGMVRESITYNGPGGSDVSGTINDPWQSAATATRTINGVTVTSRFVNTQGTHERTKLDLSRGYRRQSTRTTFDAYGMVTSSEDTGDESVTGDEQCSTTSYEPRNTTAWLVSYPQRATAYALTCDQVAAGGVTEDNVISDGRTSYDGQAFGAAPTKGDVTKTETMDAWNSGSPTYVQLTRSAYDVIGRPVESWDALNLHSATTYTPATTGPITQTDDVNPLGWKTTSIIDGAWGLATATVDVNGLRTDLAYDGLGRLTGVWQPGRVKGQDTPDIAYDYLIRRDASNAIVTHHLKPDGGILTSYALYDGLMRTRQTQTDSPAGGRILTDTFYDAAGRIVLDYGRYYAAGAPSADLVQPLNAADVPNQTVTAYDGAGRATDSIFTPRGQERWRTTTAYGGDRVDVTPPDGTTATSTVTDVQGRTTELRQYPSRFPTGSYDKTTYTYNKRGLKDTVTAPDGRTWQYTYDVRGRLTSTKDPDTGETKRTYDADGRIATSTDSRNVTLAYRYDNLSRKTGLFMNSLTGTKLADWTYDQSKFEDFVTAVKGQPTAATRYDSGRAYSTKVNTYTNRYQPTTTTISIPSGETGVGGTYTFDSGYAVDGSPLSTSYPPTGDLLSETVTLDYDGLGLPQHLKDSYDVDPQSSIVSDSSYDALANPTKYTLYTGLFSGQGSRVYLGFQNDLETGRLAEISTVRDGVSPNTVSDIHYTYDDSGNITKIADTPAGGGFSDIQCFAYDRYVRVTEAWTPTSGDCSASRSTSALGGPAPYWLSYSYDTSGRRTRQVDHLSAAGVATTDYHYPTGSSPSQPDALSSAVTTDNAGTRTAGYTFDSAGNTKTRPGPNGTQTLNWDSEGHLASVTDTAGSVSYLYDADGNRLIRRDGTGKTLYLPGEELRYTNASNTQTCTRFYSYGGGLVAQRTAAGLTWLAADHQGTQDISIDEHTQAVTIRRQTPFGTTRGPTTSWPNQKGFVGGTVDPTGLTHLGAREYDPVIGRFISADPVLDDGDPQQLQGYAYAENSPIAHSDPSGQRTDDEYYGKGGSAQFDSKQDLSQEDKDKLNKQNKGSGKKCKSLSCKLSKGWHATTKWVGEHKAAIAGAVVGVVVGGLCGAAIGWTGVGAIACGALAGAAGSMVQYAIETKVEHKGNFSLGGMLKEGAIGALVGGVMGGVGSFAGQAIKAGASSLISGAGAKAAARAAGSAMRKEAGNIVDSLTRGALRKGAAEAAEGAAPKRGPSCLIGQSFAPGTRVLMAGGAYKAIKDVKVGDQVAATDPRTGKTEAKTVTAVHVNHDVALTELSVKSADGSSSVIHTTQHHPFWDGTRRMWVGAGDLATDASLSSPAGGETVVGVVNHLGAQDMWDLTVDSIHTFYVVAGTTPVLVHNCDGGGAGSGGHPALEAGYDEPTELHHVMPQQFRAHFARAGLDIDEHTVKLPSSVHQAAHDVGWNGVWKEFFVANPNPGQEEIVRQAGNMMWEFGLDKFSQGVFRYR